MDHFSKPAAAPNAIYQLRDISGGYSPNCMQPLLGPQKALYCLCRVCSSTTQEMLAHLNVWKWWNCPLSTTDKKSMKTLNLNWYECLSVSLIYCLTCSVYWFIYVFIDPTKRNQLNSNPNIITGCIPHDALSLILLHTATDSWAGSGPGQQQITASEGFELNMGSWKMRFEPKMFQIRTA